MEQAIIDIEAREKDWPRLMPRLRESYPELAEVWGAVDSLRLDELEGAKNEAREEIRLLNCDVWRLRSVLDEAIHRVTVVCGLADVLVQMGRPDPEYVATVARDLDNLREWLEEAREADG